VRRRILRVFQRVSGRVEREHHIGSGHSFSERLGLLNERSTRCFEIETHNGCAGFLQSRCESGTGGCLPENGDA
jgi:hypothetical protein